MNILRVVIVVGQIGKIWAVSAVNKKLFQSLSVLGYYYLMESTYNNSSQVFTLGNMTTGSIEPKVEITNTKLISKRPW